MGRNHKPRLERLEQNQHMLRRGGVLGLEAGEDLAERIATTGPGVLCPKGLPLRHERFAVGPAGDHKRLRGALRRG